VADQVLTRDGPVAVPMDYVVPQGGELLPLTVRATVDGTSAAVSFYACVQVIAPSGRVMCTAITAAIAAGASADCSWFPWCRVTQTAPAPSPNPLGTLWAWYDFSDTSTLGIDGSSKIASVRDKTGNGHDLAQGTAGIRPAQTTVNGLNAALCNSTTYTYVIGGPWTPSLSQPYTVLVVHSLTIGPSSNYLPGAVGGPNTGNQVLMQTNPSGKYFLQLGASSILTTAIISPFAQFQFTAIVNGGSSALRVNGSQTNGGLSGFDLSSIALGAAHVPERPPLDEGLDGAICEVLYYQGNLTASQLSASESYLKTKWATP